MLLMGVSAGQIKAIQFLISINNTIFCFRLIMNGSLDKGSMLPYVKEAKRRKYDVVILNPNQSTVEVNGVAKRVQV